MDQVDFIREFSASHDARPAADDALMNISMQIQTDLFAHAGPNQYQHRAETTIVDGIVLDQSSTLNDETTKPLDLLQSQASNVRHAAIGNYQGPSADRLVCPRKASEGCKGTFLNAETLKKHMDMAHRRIPTDAMKCDYCVTKKVLQSMKKKREHEWKMHRKGYGCQICGLHFEKQQGWDRHQQKCRPIPPMGDMFHPQTELQQIQQQSVQPQSLKEQRVEDYPPDGMAENWLTEIFGDPFGVSEGESSSIQDPGQDLFGPLLHEADHDSLADSSDEPAISLTNALQELAGMKPLSLRPLLDIMRTEWRTSFPSWMLAELENQAWVLLIYARQSRGGVKGNSLSRLLESNEVIGDHFLRLLNPRRPPTRRFSASVTYSAQFEPVNLSIEKIVPVKIGNNGISDGYTGYQGQLTYISAHQEPEALMVYFLRGFDAITTNPAQIIRIHKVNPDKKILFVYQIDPKAFRIIPQDLIGELVYNKTDMCGYLPIWLDALVQHLERKSAYRLAEFIEQVLQHGRLFREISRFNCMIFQGRNSLRTRPYFPTDNSSTIEMVLRECCDCGIEKPLTTEFYGISGGGEFLRTCVPCKEIRQKSLAKQRNTKNAEAVTEKCGYCSRVIPDYERQRHEWNMHRVGVKCSKQGCTLEFENEGKMKRHEARCGAGKSTMNTIN